MSDYDEKRGARIYTDALWGIMAHQTKAYWLVEIHDEKTGKYHSVKVEFDREHGPSVTAL